MSDALGVVTCDEVLFPLCASVALSVSTGCSQACLPAFYDAAYVYDRHPRRAKIKNPFPHPVLLFFSC